MIDQALANGIRVSAWTFDELYGRDGKFLDALQQRGQVFVAEIPVDFHGWVRKPKILDKGPGNKGRGRAKEYPRLAAGYHSSEVRNLAKHSPVFRKQSWQRYRIKDTDSRSITCHGNRRRQDQILYPRHLTAMTYTVSNTQLTTQCGVKVALSK